ncbi:hypothetical protein B0H12DRAFT_1128920, partial [Mycena haematopus]
LNAPRRAGNAFVTPPVATDTTYIRWDDSSVVPADFVGTPAWKYAQGNSGSNFTEIIPRIILVAPIRFSASQTLKTIQFRFYGFLHPTYLPTPGSRFPLPTGNVATDMTWDNASEGYSGFSHASASSRIFSGSFRWTAISLIAAAPSDDPGPLGDLGDLCTSTRRSSFSN